MGSLLIVRLTNFLQRRLNPSLIIVQSTAPQICIAQKIADDRAAFILRNSGVNRFKCGNYIWNSFPLPPDTVSAHHLLVTGLLLSPASYRHLPFMRQNLAKYACTGNFSPSSYRPTPNSGGNVPNCPQNHREPLFSLHFPGPSLPPYLLNASSTLWFIYFSTLLALCSRLLAAGTCWSACPRFASAEWQALVVGVLTLTRIARLRLACHWCQYESWTLSRGQSS